MPDPPAAWQRSAERRSDGLQTKSVGAGQQVGGFLQQEQALREAPPVACYGRKMGLTAAKIKAVCYANPPRERCSRPLLWRFFAAGAGCIAGMPDALTISPAKSQLG
jgi:hypothetical protein